MGAGFIRAGCAVIARTSCKATTRHQVQGANRELLRELDCARPTRRRQNQPPHPRHALSDGVVCIRPLAREGTPTSNSVAGCLDAADLRELRRCDASPVDS